MFHTPDTPVIEGASNHKIAVENVYLERAKAIIQVMKHSLRKSALDTVIKR